MTGVAGARGTLPAQLGSYNNGTPLPNWYTPRRTWTRRAAGTDQKAYEQAQLDLQLRQPAARLPDRSDRRHPIVPEAAAAAVFCGSDPGVFDAILFDNDGVLVDTEQLYFRANQEIAGRRRRDAGRGRRTSSCSCGRGAAPGTWREARGLDPPTSMRCGRHAIGVTASMVATADVLIPGVAEIVAGAGGALPAGDRHQLRAGAVRADPRAHGAARRTSSWCSTQGDYARSKPEPDPYLRAVARLGVAPERCLVIEDSERGLRAAKAAGLACWVIPSGLTAGSRPSTPPTPSWTTCGPSPPGSSSRGGAGPDTGSPRNVPVSDGKQRSFCGKETTP